MSVIRMLTRDRDVGLFRLACDTGKLTLRAAINLVAAAGPGVYASGPNDHCVGGAVFYPPSSGPLPPAGPGVPQHPAFLFPGMSDIWAASVGQSVAFFAGSCLIRCDAAGGLLADLPPFHRPGRGASGHRPVFVMGR